MQQSSPKGGLRAAEIAQPPRALAVTVLGVGLLCVSSAAILFELAEAHALVKAAWRLLIASSILWLILLTKPRRRSEIAQLGSIELRWALLSGLALAAHFGLWVLSLDYTSVANSVILVTTSPLFVALLGPGILGERVGGRLLVGILIAFLGASVIVLGDSQGPGHADGASAVLGDALALGGAVAVALYFLAGRRLRSRLSLLSYVSLVYSTAAVLLLALCLLLGLPMLAHSTQTWLLFLLLALGPQLIGHSSLNWALEHASAAYVSAVPLGESVLSALLAWWILGQRIPTATWLGGGLILGGLFIASQAEQRNQLSGA